MRFFYNLAFDDWEKFKVQREPGETAHWKVKQFIIEDKPNIERLHHQTQGRDPGTGNFTGLYFRADAPDYVDHNGLDGAYAFGGGKHEWLPMMSDTRAEVTDHFEFLDKCMFPGNENLSVLITGLGLGMVAEACIKVGVGHVTVVDRDPEVIELIGGQIDHPNLRIVQADAMTWEPDRKFDLAWHDIWPTISASNLPEMAAMRRHYRRAVRYWQGFWLYERCKWMARVDRQDPTGVMRTLTDITSGEVGFKVVSMFIQAQSDPMAVWDYLVEAADADPERRAFTRNLWLSMTGKPAPDRILP